MVTLSDELKALDMKNRKFYSDLSDDDKKKCKMYPLMRYAASISSSNQDMEEYMILATNENVNVNFFDLNHHPVLQWLCITTVSPAKSIKSHFWISTKTKNKVDKKASILKNQIAQLYPLWKNEDIDLFIQKNDIKELKEWLLDHGIEL